MPRNTPQAIALAQNVGQPKPVRTRKHCPHIPPTKILRIQHRHLAGQTNREIARAEHCGRNTVSKIVKAPELQDHLQRIRERMWGLADCAADVVHEAIVENRDVRVAYELLRDVGVLPRASQIVCQPNQQPVATAENREERIIRGLAAVIAERHRVFGVQLPDEMQAVIDREEAAESTVRARLSGGAELD